MLKTVRLRSSICNPERVLLQTVRGRFTKGETMKRLMREQKQCFGALLETKKEKSLRLRREKLTSSSPETESNVESATTNDGDSEFSWMMRVSNDRLRRICASGESENSETDEKKRIGKRSVDCIEARRNEELGRPVKPLWLPRSVKRIIRCASDQKIPQECAPRFAIVKKRIAPAPVRLKAGENVFQGRKLPQPIPQGCKVPETVYQGPKIPETVSQGCKVPETNLQERELPVMVSEGHKVLQTVLQYCKNPETVSQDRKNPETVSQGCKIPETDFQSQKVAETVSQDSKISEMVFQDHKVTETVSLGRKVTRRVLDSFKVAQTALHSFKATKTAPRGRKVAEKVPQGRKIEEKGPQGRKVQCQMSKVPPRTHPGKDRKQTVSSRKTVEVPIFPKGECVQDTPWPNSKILSISTMDNPEHQNLPSVTRILNATMSDRSKKLLALWAARMTATLGEEAFNEYRKDLLESGKLFHRSIDCMLRNLPVEVPNTIKPCMKSIAGVLKEVTEIRAIESHVVHDELRYRGVIDCVATFRGKLCLIDWKKSERVKYELGTMYDAPMQLASYIGALNTDKNYPFKIKSGLLVIAYTMGYESTVYELDETQLQFYWRAWLKRLERYYAMQDT